MNKNGSNINENGNFESDSSQKNPIFHESLLDITIRYRWTIILTVAICLLASIAYLLKATPIFTSRSKLYVKQTGPKIISDYGAVRSHSKNYLYTQGELLRSPSILSQAINKPSIGQFKTFEGIDDPVGYLEKNLGIEIGRKDDIITVSLDSAYPEEAAMIVNEVVSSYVDDYANQNRSTVSEVLRLLQKEKINRDKELSEKLNSLLEFTRENGVVQDTGQNGHVVFQRLGKLSEALTMSQIETINAKADYDAAVQMAKDPIKLKQLVMIGSHSNATSVANDSEMGLRQQLRELQQELVHLTSQCTNEHPMVVDVERKISQIQSQLKGENNLFAEVYVDAINQKWQTAKMKEEKLLASFEDQRHIAQSIGVKAAEYSVLQSELRRTERLCEILDERIKELNVTEDAGALNIRILEVAKAGKRPTSPQKAKTLAMAMMMGLLMGYGLAISRGWLDYRLHSAEEISSLLGIPVLGVVPSIKTTLEDNINIGSQKAWELVKNYTGEFIEKLQQKVFLAKHEKTSSSKISNENTSKQLTVLSSGKNMLLKVWPAISQACKTVRNGIAISNRDGEYRDDANTDVEIMPNQENQKQGKGWLDAQHSVGDLYQQRLDNVLFGKTPKRTEHPAKKVVVEANDKVSINPDTNSVERGQEVRLKPRSVVAESYRTIRTAVFFGVPKDEAKTILVTSPAPGDGKSTLVSNLGIAMAQAGQKTLIMDCDFRKPRQNCIFEIDNNKGISNVLAGEMKLDEVIHKSPTEGLDLLTRGPEVPNPSEILNSEMFGKLIEKLRSKYDRIIIDSPPATAVADSRILSATCDVTLLVLRAMKSTRRLSIHAMENLSGVGAKVLGAIVNDVHVSGGKYGSYGSYGYGYYGGYGYGEQNAKSHKPETAGITN